MIIYTEGESPTVLGALSSRLLTVVLLTMAMPGNMAFVPEVYSALRVLYSSVRCGLVLFPVWLRFLAQSCKTMTQTIQLIADSDPRATNSLPHPFQQILYPLAYGLWQRLSDSPVLE